MYDKAFCRILMFFLLWTILEIKWCCSNKSKNQCYLQREVIYAFSNSAKADEIDI